MTLTNKHKVTAYLFAKRFNSTEYSLKNKAFEKLFEELLLSLSSEFSQKNIHSNFKKAIPTNKQSMIAEYTSIVNQYINTNKDIYVVLCAMIFLDIKNKILIKKDKLIASMLIELGYKIPNGIDNPTYTLTTEFDNFSLLIPYSLRVASTNEFFSTANIQKYISDKKIANECSNIYKELAPIFHIVLNESVKQSGISLSGTDYEKRIENVLKHFKLKFKKHTHEEDDNSIEHDLVISYNNKLIGIGAKRTLRERYKQYNPKEIDMSIVFTFGNDLTITMAETITSNYNLFMIVADEAYEEKNYLKNNKKVFKATDFSPKLLDEMIKALGK